MVLSLCVIWSELYRPFFTIKLGNKGIKHHNHANDFKTTLNCVYKHIYIYINLKFMQPSKEHIWKY